MAGRKTISLTKLQKVKEHLTSKKDSHPRRIGLVIDGPNMLRKEFSINLYEIRDILLNYGDIKVAKVFLNQYAGVKLVEAVEAQGLTPVITSGDVSVKMAVESMEMVYNDAIDTIALVTRDADFKAVLNKAMETGKETIIIGIQPGFSTALKNHSDIAVILRDEDFEEEYEEMTDITDELTENMSNFPETEPATDSEGPAT